MAIIASRRRLLAGAAAGAAAALPLAGLPARAQERVKSGTVFIEQIQLAFIGSGGAGDGTLFFHGRTYRFSVGGLGVGGFGVSKMEATGEVYNLEELSQVPGAYGAARYGAAFGDKGGGELWLQNPKGVIMSLKTKREGLAVSLGADAMVVAFK